MDFLAFLGNIPALLGQHLSTLVGLVFLDLVLGVSVALRTGEFNFDTVAMFYKTNVLPFVIGSIGVSGAVMFVAPELLPGNTGEAFALVVAWVGFSTIVGQLLFGSIVPNVRALVLGVSRWELPDEDFEAEIVG